MPPANTNVFPLRLAPFTLTNMTTGRAWHLRANRSGRFERALPPGRYGVRVWGRNGELWKFNVDAGQTTTQHFVAISP